MDSIYSRYASALLSIAIDENNVSFYKDEIKMLKEVFNENKEILHLFSSYFIEDKEKEKVVDEIYSNNINIQSFIKILIKNKLINKVDKVFDEFIKEANEYIGIKEGIIYSVNPLTKEQIDNVQKALSKKLNTQVELVNQIDSRLISGIKITIEDKVFDGSVKNKLEKLKEDLIKGGYQYEH